MAAGGGVEANALRVTIASDSTGVVSVDDNGGSLTVDGTVTIQDGGNVISVDDGAGSLTVDGTVTANAGTGTFTAKETRAGTSAVTSVNDSAVSATLLASNANRLGCTIHNDSSSTLYVKYGTTASASDYTHKLYQDDVLIEDQYTGRIDGIWSADSSGAARVTELTA